jgi:hypothetical protein
MVMQMKKGTDLLEDKIILACTGRGEEKKKVT